VLAGAGPLTTGLASGVMCAALVVYPIFKRVARARAIGQKKIVDPERANKSRVRVHYVAHVALGIFAVGIVFAHVAARSWSSLGAALAAVFAVTSVFGISSAIAYAWSPRVLTRLDRKGAL